jgi:Helix-turn-helix domain
MFLFHIFRSLISGVIAKRYITLHPYTTAIEIKLGIRFGRRRRNLEMPDAQPVRSEKLWYTVKDLAAEWGLSEGCIRDHATRKRPRIKGRKFGKFIKFHKNDIQTFLDEIATVKDHAA